MLRICLAQKTAKARAFERGLWVAPKEKDTTKETFRGQASRIGISLPWLVSLQPLNNLFLK